MTYSFRFLCFTRELLQVSKMVQEYLNNNYVILILPQITLELFDLYALSSYVEANYPEQGYVVLFKYSVQPLLCF